MATTWTVTETFYDVSLDGHTNVVTKATFLVTANSGEESASIGDVCQFDTSNLTDFTPYDSLTENEVLGWITNTLGPDNVALYNSRAEQKLQNKISPPTGSGLPWDTPEEPAV